jgi:hypothetical protein
MHMQIDTLADGTPVIKGVKLPKAVKRALVAEACKTYKTGRIAYKHTRPVKCQARRDAHRPGPVIHRPALVEEMNRAILAGVQA